MRISIVGAGYVGLSLAVMLSIKHEVHLVEIDPKKLSILRDGLPPIKDKLIDQYFSEKHLNLVIHDKLSSAVINSEFVIIATPTNYDPQLNHFDVSSVTSVIKEVEDITPNSQIVIKSTLPVGYTENISKELNKSNISFSPEFLREGTALKDNLYPSRIIVGTNNVEVGNEFANLLKDCSLKSDVECLIMPPTEAESVKLFSNTFLALRVAYFNELDTYASIKGLNTEKIIKGVCLDPRIGDFYNNPSFGYGGYCLPKDSKQLLSNYQNVPNTIIKAVVESNKVRKDFITEEILGFSPKVVGFYRITMKAGSDNFRESSVLDIIQNLIKSNIHVIIYEPLIKTQSYMNCDIIDNLDEFKNRSDLVVANRITEEIIDLKSSNKLYTKDLFQKS